MRYKYTSDSPKDRIPSEFLPCAEVEQMIDNVDSIDDELKVILKGIVRRVTKENRRN